MNKIISMDDMVPLIKEQVQNNGEVIFTPKGISMLPMLRNNQDTVTLINAELPLKKYQIALYVRDSGQYVLHRVIDASDDGYVMRGDHQFVNEPGIRDDQIIAVVTKFTRKGKEYMCSDKSYILYYRIWVNTVKIRRLIKRVRNLAGRVKRKILRILR